MLNTFHALLKGDRLEWQGDAPEQTDGQAIRVQVTLLDDADPSQTQGAKMAAALERLAELRAFEAEKDPSAWEKETRQDRELPGRP